MRTYSCKLAHFTAANVQLKTDSMVNRFNLTAAV